MRDGETAKKAKVTQHAGGKSVSEKSQGTHTSRNPCEKSSSHTEYFVRVGRTDGLGMHYDS